MNRMSLIERLLMLSVVLGTVSLQIHPTEARQHRSTPRYSRTQRLPSYAAAGPSRPAAAGLDSDSELLRALEFLEKYERMKGNSVDQREVEVGPRMGAPLPPLYAGPYGSRDFLPPPYSMKHQQRVNEAPSTLDLDNSIGIPYRPMTSRWEEEVEIAAEQAEAEEEGLNNIDLALEDLYAPRPQDLETNEEAFAEAAAEEFRENEGRRQKDLFEKILGDVMAEKLLQQDEEDKIEELLEAQDEEKQGLEDLAAIVNSENSAASSSVPERGGVGLYDPEELQLSMFSASSVPGDDEIFADGGASSSSAAEGAASESDVDVDVDGNSYELSEAGIEALDEAEKILKEGFEDSSEEEEDEDDGASSESMPDFDATSASDAESSTQEEEGGVKENVLKDVIYRIVQNNLRRKLEESMSNGEQYEGEMSVASSIPEEGEQPDFTDGDDKNEQVLDTLVDEIRYEVNQLTSKIMGQIEGLDESDDDDDDDDDESVSQSREDSNSFAGPVPGSASYDDGFDVERPFVDMEASSSSIPDGEFVDVGVSSSTSARDMEDEFAGQFSSSASEDEEEEDEELLNAIREIIPAAQTEVCPVLSYLVDDCSVVEGFKGLGTGGYREAFSRPCNRHQLCYICSNSYGIPTNLCDEIYKAELLTLCNGDSECTQRAKYFWIAATSDRSPPRLPLSFCSDHCLLDYLLED